MSDSNYLNIKIDALEKEFQLILNQYQEIHQTFVSDLQTTSDNFYETDSTLITFYSDINYTGTSSTFGIGSYCVGDANVSFPNDSLNSLEVPDNLKITLYQDGIGSNSLILGSGNYPDLSTYNFSNIVSCWVIESTNENTNLDFKVFQGKAFTGSSTLKEGTSQTQSDCETMCASDLLCSGATFNSDNNYCKTISGNGIINKGLTNDYALIPKNKYNLMILNTLNNKLLTINSQIVDELNLLYPLAKSEIDQKNKKQIELDKNYTLLLEQEKQLLIYLNENKMFEEELKDNSLYVNQQNLNYKIWIGIAIILFLITVKTLININGNMANGLISNSSSFLTTNFVYIFLLIIVVFFVFIYNK